MATRQRMLSSIHTYARRDPSICQLIDELAGYPCADAHHLSDERLALVYQDVERRLSPGLDRRLFAEAMKKTQPVLRAPAGGRPRLEALVAQPEIERFLFEDWTAPQPARGPRPAHTEAKALLCTQAWARTGPYLTQAYDLLSVDRELAAALMGGQTAIGSYPALARLVGDLSPHCADAAMAANVAMVRALREAHPEIGRRLMIDGTAVPAWCIQRGSGGDERLEAELRKRTPHAGFRAYTQTAKGKLDAHKGTRSVTKAWRGYTLVVIADQASGLPLVWVLNDATQDEARALGPLLAKLHALWPDIGAELIIGDSAWDEDWACQMCETDYGIHPVFRLHNEGTRTRLLTNGESRSGGTIAIDPHGRLICAVHGVAHGIATVSQPVRNVSPGTPTKHGQHRVRVVCAEDRPGAPPCGKLGMRMEIAWRRLTSFPHHPEGNPERYAWRCALLSRRNGIESLFARAKIGVHMATSGADRMRVVNHETVLAAVSLTFVSFSGLAVAEVRGDLVGGEPRRSGTKQGAGTYLADSVAP